METEDSKSKSSPKAIIFLVVVIALMAAGVFYYQHQRNAELEAQEAKAQEMFAPVFMAMDEAAKDKPEDAKQPYDIDKTVRVIHGLDKALEQSESLQDYLTYMAKQDYRGVSPEVLEGRKKVLDVLLRLYAKQTEIENQEATFTVTRTILSAMTMVDADFNIATGGAPTVDREEAKKVLADLKEEQAERQELLNELVALETEMLAVMGEYSEVYYNHLAEWDRVVTVRDRAYLAAARGNWSAAEGAATKAMELAPSETEAHLIKALSLIEQYEPTNAEGDPLGRANALLGDYIKEHPDRTAPALVLLGMTQERMGNAEEASLNYQQAAAYYPKQADNLTDMLDPYRVRSYLRKTKEGDLIVDLYESTMLGAGIFSPDLHLARGFFAKGEVDKGRKKVLDHFSRRRNQAQWNLILSDLEYCTQNLGTDFDKIFIEKSHLRLEAEPTLIGSKLAVKVNNQSKRKLYNATLLLALRFTDMHREDWQVFKVGETVPLVDANAKTDFGDLEIQYEFLGQVRGVDDIVANRAILVTDDAVMWVDTDEYKLALARQQAKQAQADPQIAKQRQSWFDAMKLSPTAITSMIQESGNMNVDLGIGKDDISVKLPREVALLNPVFRIKTDDGEVAPSANKLSDDGIQLEFGDVANLEAKDAPAVFTVVLHSRFGEFEIDLDVAKRKIAGVRYK